MVGDKFSFLMHSTWKYAHGHCSPCQEESAIPWEKEDEKLGQPWPHSSVLGIDRQAWKTKNRSANRPLKGGYMKCKLRKEIQCHFPLLDCQRFFFFFWRHQNIQFWWDCSSLLREVLPNNLQECLCLPVYGSCFYHLFSCHMNYLLLLIKDPWKWKKFTSLLPSPFFCFISILEDTGFYITYEFFVFPIVLWIQNEHKWRTTNIKQSIQYTSNEAGAIFFCSYYAFPIW